MSPLLSSLKVSAVSSWMVSANSFPRISPGRQSPCLSALLRSDDQNHRQPTIRLLRHFPFPPLISVIVAAEILQIYSDGGHCKDYWRYCFPAFIVSSRLVGVLEKAVLSKESREMAENTAAHSGPNRKRQPLWW
ncbi:hypothetical protein DB88DRAFT_127895 [Papiliotrema laurentii]|uniref:Uncharacterized protein n=1 Tax=Papiliotrema laurentii TaxID=5418 RepID=A0AAD9CSJ9_PAPLA|nr:hypothetical protein DB88DRAFT_130142 [Papiliotrema laurentii]KAK1920723.1 hypothetical protein DB88DRAFT_127895 [Papiliotrema laurentii]